MAKIKTPEEFRKEMGEILSKGPSFPKASNPVEQSVTQDRNSTARKRKLPIEVGGALGGVMKRIQADLRAKGVHIPNREELGELVKASDEQFHQDLRVENQRRKQAQIEERMRASDLNPDWNFKKASEIASRSNVGEDFRLGFQTVNSIKEYFEGVSNLDKGLGIVFMGDYGRGKSTLGGAIHEIFLDHGKTSIMAQWARLCDKAYSFDGDEVNIELKNHIETVDMLIIDEVCSGQKRLSPFQQDKLSTLIRSRQAQRLATVVITNLDAETLQTGIGTAAYEGLLEYEPFVHLFVGETFRDRELRDFNGQPIEIKELVNKPLTPAKLVKPQEPPAVDWAPGDYLTKAKDFHK
ncbi:hypothetical protein FCL40_17765 [Ferrimonas sediminicola]|uniref:Uncharacterized protein n=1 Tax=Ferrimonas sediminicola TaxID=2569538 RepID=A0A4U1B7J2_9GAMM|nr:ATP-binding protein [Ferrimonas sediminicola]TKB46497.1 hypothetical protein FCL40_17765 [Ferrimonas sediminicola]